MTGVQTCALPISDEVGWRCPFTGSPFLATEFDDLTITRIADAKWPHREKFLREAKAALPGLEVEHLTPKADLVCNEWFNLTVTTRKVNDLKAGRSPYKAFNEQQDPPWDALTKRAAERFGKESLKYRIFIHPNPAELIEERHSLQRTAYIARCARAVVLLTFGWVDETGHDPRLTPGNEASLRYHVSNGALTSRLRKAWHMDELLWDDLPFFDDAAFAAKSAEEKAHIKAEREARKRKNRLDQRHHAFDAMIVSCTIPWFAHRVSQVQGWNEYDPARGIERVFCPVFNDHGHGLHEAARLARDKMAKSATTDEVFKVEHHSPKKTHKAQFKTTLYGRRESFKGDELPQAVFVARDKLTNLVESNLSATKDDGTGNNGSYIFSPLLSKHIATAWADWKTKPENWSAVVADANRAAEARLAEVRANPKSKQTTIRAAESRVWNTQKFATMEPTPQSWTAILTWLDKERGTQQPKPCLPEQFVAGLQHPIYHTPLRSVKMTAQTKDEDAMLETRVDADPAKCSKTFVYFQGYRELRVYEGRRGKSVQYKGWLVRGYYRPGKRITEHTPSEFAKLPHVGTFKKDQVLKFLRDTKDIKADEAWIIRGIRKGIKVTLERAVHAREAKVLLPVASSSNGDGVTAARPGSRKASSYETITADTQVLGLEDLMLGLQPPETNELPHSPPTQL